MKILITGASGFIGSFLVEAALNRGWEVWAGIRQSSNLRYLKAPSLHFIDLNYTDERLLALQIEDHLSNFGKWDYIIHNAGVTKCVDNSDYERINHQFTVHFIQALINNCCQPKKFLFISSMGAVGPGDSHTGSPRKMADQANPISAYGLSKLHAEDYIRKLSGFPWVILRPTGVYGPRDRDYFVMMKMLKSGLNFSVGFKQQLLSFIYVKDLARACILALESPIMQKTWFVADGDYYTSTEYARVMQEVLQKKCVLSILVPLWLVHIVSVVSESISQLTGKPALLNTDKYEVMKQRNWTCDASELEFDLAFKAEYNLKKGLEETAFWYTKNDCLE